MQNTSEESVKFNRQFKRALIVFAIIEFVVTVLVVVRFIQK